MIHWVDFSVLDWNGLFSIHTHLLGGWEYFSQMTSFIVLTSNKTRKHVVWAIVREIGPTLPAGHRIEKNWEKWQGGTGLKSKNVTKRLFHLFGETDWKQNLLCKICTKFQCKIFRGGDFTKVELLLFSFILHGLYKNAQVVMLCWCRSYNREPKLVTSVAYMTLLSCSLLLVDLCLPYVPESW